jgi:hypothetical protein
MQPILNGSARLPSLLISFFEDDIALSFGDTEGIAHVDQERITGPAGFPVA